MAEKIAGAAMMGLGLASASIPVQAAGNLMQQVGRLSPKQIKAKEKKELATARSLIGKPVEITPWHQPWEKGDIRKGVLRDVKRIRVTSYDPIKKRRVRHPDEFSLRLQPDKETRKWLKDLRILKSRERTVGFMLRGHRIRGQVSLKDLI